MADICLAALATGSLPERWSAFVCLLLASTLLYFAGMVWNDYFDLVQDCARTALPADPVGADQRAAAAAGLGLLLFAAGMVFATFADWAADGDRWRATGLAGGLIAAILLYDGWLKRTCAGPVAMGTCRFLNVLLGPQHHWHGGRRLGVVCWPWSWASTSPA